METKILLAYFAIGFVLLGWRFDLIEKNEKESGQQENGFSKALAVSWLFFWPLPMAIILIIGVIKIAKIIPFRKVLRIVKIVFLAIVRGKAMTWQEFIEKASEDGHNWSFRARLDC